MNMENQVNCEDKVYGFMSTYDPLNLDMTAMMKAISGLRGTDLNESYEPFKIIGLYDASTLIVRAVYEKFLDCLPNDKRKFSIVKKWETKAKTGSMDYV